MNYTVCEVLLLSMLMVSLVVAPPVKLLTNFFLILLVLTLCAPQIIWGELDLWLYSIKFLSLVFGFICLSFNSKSSSGSSEILMLCVILAAMMMVSSQNLLELYLCLELQSLAMFILMASNSDDLSGVEASLKYFVLSSISSGVFLLGSSLIFINTGSCDLLMLESNAFTLEKSLMVMALMFKLAASPFHFWAPDVYQGTDNSMLCVLGVLPKISVFGMLLLMSPNNKLVLMSAIISVMIGALGAINQSNFKSLLAYSSILGIGFIFLGLAVNTTYSLSASYMYMVMYLITFLGVMMLSDLVSKEKDLMSEFSSLMFPNKVLLPVFSLLLLSLAGMPPLGGFLAKWTLLSSAIDGGFVFSSLLSVVCAMIAGLYYLSLVKMAFFQGDSTFIMWSKILIKGDNSKTPNLTFLGMMVYLMLFSLANPEYFGEISHLASMAIF